MDDSDVEFPVAPPTPRKGRGAVTNLQGRYEIEQRAAVDDGWPTEEEDAPPLRTEVFEERAKSILTRNASPDVPFHVSLNPYRGCEHGCIYCFARPTHSYLGLSPGLDFESRIYAKMNAAELLERELSKKSYVPEAIALGVNTDAYQPWNASCALRAALSKSFMFIGTRSPPSRNRRLSSATSICSSQWQSAAS